MDSSTITSIFDALIHQGPLVSALIAFMYYLKRNADQDRLERQHLQTTYLELFKETNDTLNEYIKVIEGVNNGFQIMINHILNSK